jgi:proteasome lid subunit RPN8/RPN11
MVNEIKNKTISKIHDFVVNSCNEQTSQEVCGFIGYNESGYIATVEKNDAADPKNFFTINPASYLMFSENNDMLAVFHSHIVGDETPSEFDIKMAEACCIPFVVYSLNTKKFHIYEPSQYELNVKAFTRLKDHFK